MTTLLVHFVILGWISAAIARRLVPDLIDRIIATAMLLWGHIVVFCLLLSLVGKLGDPAWFFRGSLLLGLGSLLLVRRFVAPAPAPTPAAPTGDISWALVLAVVASLGVILLVHIRIAAAYLPNNYDSLTYHLPRVMYYMGHHTLAQFHSDDIRQVYFPFNYNLLQLFCLIYSPPHEVINFINVIAWVIAGLGVYRVSRLCACSCNGALIATWLALTGAEVLAQANTTTLDLSTAAALLAAVGFGLRWRQDRQPRDALLAGLAAGLAGGVKLTVVFFGPAVVLLLLVWGYQQWRQVGARAAFAQVRPWILPAIVAGLVALPFILYNLAATGEWMTHKMDFTLNKPFSLGVALQTAKGYLFQLFFEPFGRFTFDLGVIEPLNNWYSQTFFKSWNESYAFSGFYVIPPDLNEDHVWYSFAGPFLLVCGVICLGRDRRLRGPLAWLALLGLGWFATYFAMNKWSLYIQRYFLPALVLMGPCAAAVWDGARTGARGWITARRFVFALVAATSLWMAVVYLGENRNRPFSFPGSSYIPPKILPDIPPLLRQRLAPQPLVNIISEGTNERIYLLMTFGHNQRFTSTAEVAPERYNLFSYWGFTRNNIYSNIAHIASHTLVSLPTKPTAGMEFLGTVGEGVNAFDYAGLAPHAATTPSAPENRNIMILVHYGPTEPDRFAHCRIRVEGLNPGDHARVEITAELTNGTRQPIMAQTHSGEVKFSLTKPFKRLAIQVVDVATGKIIGVGDLPYTTKPTDADILPPVNATTLFQTELIRAGTARTLSVNGLADIEGPYAQWELPVFRWAKQPVVRIEVPPNPRLKRIRVAFGVRLQVREDATLRITHNGRFVQDFALHGHGTWLNQSVDIAADPGDNMIELSDYQANEVPDWLAYLDQNPDVKANVLAQHQSLEAGAKLHYEMFGRKEHRPPLKMKPNPNPPAPPPESLYFLYHSLLIEGFTE